MPTSAEDFGEMTQPPDGEVADFLVTHRDEIVANWTTNVASSLQGRITREELERELAGLFEALLAGVSSDQDPREGEAYGEVRALLAELSRNRARQGFSPTETAGSVFMLKEAVRAIIAGRTEAKQLLSYVELGTILDALGLYTFETYVENRDRIIVAQSEELMELSTPVVKLWEGIIAVPLVGTLDSARTQIVTEKLLEALVQSGSANAIIDITGVPAVDTQVVQHLLKTVVAARLMGADCIISGIRPQIAQTIVALGIEFGDVATKATLADALVLALRKTGVSVGQVS